MARCELQHRGRAGRWVEAFAYEYNRAWYKRTGVRNFFKRPSGFISEKLGSIAQMSVHGGGGGGGGGVKDRRVLPDYTAGCFSHQSGLRPVEVPKSAEKSLLLSESNLQSFTYHADEVHSLNNRSEVYDI